MFKGDKVKRNFQVVAIEISNARTKHVNMLLLRVNCIVRVSEKPMLDKNSRGKAIKVTLQL